MLQDWLDIEARTWFAGRIFLVTEAIAERMGKSGATARQRGLTLGSGGRRDCGNGPSSRSNTRHAKRERFEVLALTSPILGRRKVPERGSAIQPFSSRIA